MQTSLHILALTEELRRHAVGAAIVGTEYYKKERLLLIFFRGSRSKEKCVLYFSFHPEHAGAVFLPAVRLSLKTSERPQALFTIASGECTEILYPALDRIFALRCATPKGERVFAVEAIGPNGSVWLCDADLTILGSLRGRDFVAGERYDFHPQTTRLDPRSITSAELSALLASASNPLRALEKGVSGISATLAREALFRAVGDAAAPMPFSDQQLDALASEFRALAAAYLAPESGLLYPLRAGWEAFPIRLRSTSETPEKFRSFAEAMYASLGRRAEAVKEDSSERRARDRAEQMIEKLRRLLDNLTQDITTAADFERWRLYGELLTTHHDQLKKGMKEIHLSRTPSGEEVVSIPLDPAKPVSAQAEIYFQKCRKGREGLALLERRQEITRQELGQWQHILQAVTDDPEAAQQRYAAELWGASKSTPASGSKSIPAPRLPYREHTLSTGAKIFIGRDGTDNDATTFQHARPYELWFHAQQCPGSHVILKFPNKSFVPSKAEIEETAAIAAFHSKARKNKLVPVIYAERKYVRKPRGAKPGLVVVEREKSVMVEPRDPSGENPKKAAGEPF